MTTENVANTLSGALFSDGWTLSGTWTDSFSGSTLTGVSAVSMTITNGSSHETFGSGSTNLPNGVSVDTASSTSEFQIHVARSGGSYDIGNVYLDFSAQYPTSLFTGTSDNGHEFTSLKDYTSGTAVEKTLTSGGTITTETLCFCAGTRIATPQGEVAVEDLKAGDLVRTATGAKPVRWRGRSDVSATFADPLRSAPIRISAGALGDGLPLRDLRVSPAHAIFIDGVLVQAAALVNGGSIVRERVTSDFSYYHVELDSHALLISEGLTTESFVDNAARMNFSNWAERIAPETCIEELPYPRVKSARQLPAALRAKLAVAFAA